MVNRRNGIGKHPAQEIADEGHQRLERTKPRAADQGCFQVCPPHGQSLTHGHRKGIHAQANAQH